jgi:hypothetical protein
MSYVESDDAFGFKFAVPASQPLRLYAGQADPRDDSHFTIPFETPSGNQVIDGWLKPDDTISLQVRKTPTGS